MFIHPQDWDQTDPNAQTHGHEQATQITMGRSKLRSERPAELQRGDHAPQPSREDVQKPRRCVDGREATERERLDRGARNASAHERVGVEGPRCTTSAPRGLTLVIFYSNNTLCLIVACRYDPIVAFLYSIRTQVNLKQHPTRRPLQRSPGALA